MRELIFLTVLAASFAAFANPLEQASTPQEYLRIYLEQLRASPEARMAVPPKFSADGRRLFHPPIKEAKMFPAPSATFAEPDRYNQLSLFYKDYRPETDIAKLFPLTFGRADVWPWSGSYWPTYRLGIAERYADPEYPTSTAYADYVNFYKTRKPFAPGDQKAVDALSPAEKYDLLMNDPQKSLTKYSIAHGATAYPRGVAQKWFGLCHGWAAASFSVPRPRRPVDIQINKDVKVRFYPDDIKALATLLWSNAFKKDRFVGNRCRVDASALSGPRPRRAECFDINPGTWHVLVVNELAIRKTNFIIDATYDLEVWNQPVRAYKVTYFNPKTREIAVNLSDARVLRRDFPEDPYAKFRSRQAHSLVGVSMELEYVNETNAIQEKYNDEKEDFSNVVQYIYDLEIDAAGKIVGGEWYQESHPDFVWAPETTDPQSVGDADARGEWLNDVPPAEWLPAAQRAALKGQPLAKVVKKLVKLAQDKVQ